mmetsp:Transcript_128604/g.320733  ORF Transcript_128604/g.320733 Transcript_128604/m.320733 type:complete len:123 (+) Transcript_128604:495-863(+)
MTRVRPAKIHAIVWDPGGAGVVDVAAAGMLGMLLDQSLATVCVVDNVAAHVLEVLMDILPASGVVNDVLAGDVLEVLPVTSRPSFDVDGSPSLLSARMEVPRSAPPRHGNMSGAKPLADAMM